MQYKYEVKYTYNKTLASIRNLVYRKYFYILFHLLTLASNLQENNEEISQKKETSRVVIYIIKILFKNLNFRISSISEILQ